jgi:heme a synthase
MSIGSRDSSTGLLSAFALGSVISTYILIVIGGYVTTSNSGAACGSAAGADSWPLCNGALFPSLSNSAQVIEYTHRVFNIVVGLFVLGTAILAWTRYKREKNIVMFSTAGFVGLLAQVLLGMVTVTSDLNPIVSDAHLSLATAVFALLVVNAVMVWNLQARIVSYDR